MLNLDLHEEAGLALDIASLSLPPADGENSAPRRSIEKMRERLESPSPKTIANDKSTSLDAPAASNAR
jgi:hypothetical protein